MKPAVRAGWLFGEVGSNLDPILGPAMRVPPSWMTTTSAPPNQRGQASATVARESARADGVASSAVSARRTRDDSASNLAKSDETMFGPRGGREGEFSAGAQAGQTEDGTPDAEGIGARSGEVMRAIEQLLATSGEPMHVKVLTAAPRRPTEGKAGTAAVETIRATRKRLVGHGRIAEVKTAVFAMARASGARAADESGDEAGSKGAA
ncbi:hypothetical protein [Streptomyces sp. NPDC086519]|uniref:hypothetical protein n=1 Tax=Streptomyces sp. NPDC086519 TaxID=3154863 RepID=UPI00343A51D5